MAYIFRCDVCFTEVEGADIYDLPSPSNCEYCGKETCDACSIGGRCDACQDAEVAYQAILLELPFHAEDDEDGEC